MKNNAQVLYRLRGFARVQSWLSLSSVIVIVCLGVAALSSTSMAIDVTIDDHIFPLLHRLGDPDPLPFSESLACGQTSVFDSTETHCNIQCTKSYCKSVCDSARSGDPTKANSFKVFTDECSPGLTHIFGENGLIVEVTEAEYLREGGFWIKPLLEQIGQFIQPTPVSIHINWFFPSTVRRIVDGKMQMLPIDWVSGSVSFGPGLQTQTVNLWLAPSLKGADQIIRLSLDDNDVFMRLHGVVQGPTGL